ncbi:MAG: pilus assembly protein [Chloroflexi bacterium]|nr:pilus assembly protein [Chloroflexota bacterium]
MVKLAMERARGQGLVEYGLIIMLVAMIVIILLWLLGEPIANVFSNVISNL